MGKKQNVWLVTGCSTGFGRCLAEELLRNNCQVMMTVRDLSTVDDLVSKYPNSARSIKCDVTNNNEILETITKTLEAFDRIDFLVNNAGYGILGVLEEVSEIEIHKIFNTNVFGLLNFTKAVLPQMRKQKSGHIFNISSVAGLVSMPGFGIYNASKYAVEGASEALADEVKSFGIKVSIIEPGPFRTDFANRSLKVMPEMKEYDEANIITRGYTRRVDGNQPGDPVRAAKAIIAISQMTNPPLRLPFGKMAVERIKGKMESFNNDLVSFEKLILETDYPIH